MGNDKLLNGNLVIKVNKTYNFPVDFTDVSTDYRLDRVNTNASLIRWVSNPMAFYQNQLNFAVYCATTACGVGLDSLNDSNDFVRSVFRFHLYFTTRKILNAIRAPLPIHAEFDQTDNNYDETRYNEIKKDYAVRVDDFKQTRDRNTHGLGTFYIVMDGKPVPQTSQDPSQWGIDPSWDLDDPLKHDAYYKKWPSSVYIQQAENVETSWLDFIPKNSALTVVGKNAVNESIRAYVYSLLDGQATVRASAVAVGSIAQVEFKNIVESIVSSEEDVSTSIARYQDSLANAKTLPDYNIGSGLLLIPSDMNLSMGKYEGYNDQLVYSSDDTPLGKIDSSPRSSTLPNLIQNPLLPNPTFLNPLLQYQKPNPLLPNLIFLNPYRHPI